MERKKENITFYCGEQLLIKLDEMIKDRDHSRSFLLKRFVNHYVNNPVTFEQLFWELEKPKAESEV